jgi:FMN phosphatase YigB (HAD superfamily)
MSDKIAAVFFDLGDTLGTAVVSAEPVHLTGFKVFPFVPDLLESLRQRHVRLGVISNTGADGHETVDAVLAKSGLLAFFEPELRIYSKDVGHTKDDTEIFQIAIERAGMSKQPDRCLFVGEDADERGVAVDAGMRVLSDPLLVAGALDQS